MPITNPQTLDEIYRYIVTVNLSQGNPTDVTLGNLLLALGQAIENSATGAGVASFNTRTGAVTAQTGDYTVSQVTGAAPTASPTFTGTPAAPTATGGTNTTQLATTAFVQSALPTSLPPSGTAGGDLSGTFPTPGVKALNGTTLSGLATGILKNTTSTGVPSIAAAADIPTVAQGSTGPLSATDASTTNSRAPNGSAGGDLSSTYPNPTVAKINGSALGTTSGASTNDVLTWNGSAWTHQAPGGSGAMTLISSNVLGSPALVFSFTSIPGSYNHLQVIVQAVLSEGTTDNYILVVNTDTGSNYARCGITNTGSALAAHSGGSASNCKADLNDIENEIAWPSMLKLTIPHYAGTTLDKTIDWRSQASDSVGTFWAQHDYSFTWASTAAITQLDIKTSGGNHFRTGSSAYLYGIT